MRNKRILIACEESQAVTIEMRKLGIEAYSCDIEPCSGGHPEWHLQQDIIPLLQEKWDMIIAFPPCTYLSNAGNRWFNKKRYGESAKLRKQYRKLALNFVLTIWNAPCERIAIENPVGYLNSHFRRFDQIIHPCYFGDPENKRTCLWLKNLPILMHTKVVNPRIYGYYKKGRHKGEPIYKCGYTPPSKDRAKIRSKTSQGIAKAMATQWGTL